MSDKKQGTTEFMAAANMIASHMEGKSSAYMSGLRFAVEHLEPYGLSYRNELHQGWLREQAVKIVKSDAKSDT